MLFFSLGCGGRQVVVASLGCEVKRLGLGSNGFQVLFIYLLFIFLGSTKGAGTLGVDLRRTMDWF